jgi:hypothetical protein
MDSHPFSPLARQLIGIQAEIRHYGYCQLAADYWLLTTLLLLLK